MDREIRILIVADVAADAGLIAWELQKAKMSATCRRVETLDAFLKELAAFEPDVVLSDHPLCNFTVLEALEILKEKSPSVPLIVIAENMDERAATDMIHAGASDYVTRAHLFQIVPAIIDSLAKKQAQEERETVAEKLHQSERQYRLLFENNPQPIWIYDLETLAFVNVNEAAVQQYGYSKNEFLSMNLRDLRPQQDGPLLLADITRLRTQTDIHEFARHQKKDGSVIEVEVTSHPITFEGRQARLVLAHDVTSRKRAEVALLESERRFRETLKNIQMIAIILDPNGKISFCNDFLVNLTGWTEQEILGSDWFDLFLPSQDRDSIRKSFFRNLSSGQILGHRENDIVTRTGARRTILWNHTVLRDSAGNTTGITSIGQDITERKKSEEALKTSETRYRLLFERNLAGVYRTTVDGRILDCNEAFAKIFGFDSVQEIMKCSILQFYFHPSRRETFLERLRESQVLTSFESAMKRKDGNIVWVLENVTLLKNDQDAEIMEGTMLDITERKLAEEQLQYLANYDQLTDLPTRLLFNDRLKQAIIDATTDEQLVAVLLLDLDRFKTINDSLGREPGDMLLRYVAQRLAVSVPAGSTVARWGGDEFIFILRDINEVQQVADLAQNILATFERPFQFGNQQVYLSGSIGITLFPMDDLEVENLLKNAETAMYKAKGEGRNNYQFFTAEMQMALLRQVSIETSLRHALERSELWMAYQPKVDIRSGRIIGTEALLRWQHPKLGAVAPAQFIALAEETGSIMALGEWVLRKACEQIRSWQLAKYPPLSIAINLSARQFRQRYLPRIIAGVLESVDLDPSLLELEITETVLMQSTPDSLEKLRELKSLGIRITIDDFGTGFSSLSYLKQFPIDNLKIDQSFVKDIPLDANDTAITRAIILLAHSLQLKVVAEGVENESQLLFLKQENCDEMQGFYFSPPVTASEFEKLLQQEKRLSPLNL